MNMYSKNKMREMSYSDGGGSSSMPDVAQESRNHLKGTLDFVGMSKIEVPVRLLVYDGVQEMSAKAEAFVNLTQEEAKGIHMSRLYLALEESLKANNLTPQVMSQVLERFLETHTGLSDSAHLSLKFELGLQRTALKSGRVGYRSYPVVVRGNIHNGAVELEVGVEVTYSSTCPCSAALARQLIQEKFAQDFSAQSELQFDKILQWLGTENGIVATPHSQRSTAKVMVKIASDVESFPFVELIDLVESSLKTPVQAAVKREDEQEFARLNGQNLMFCEDAARKIKTALNARPEFLDFWLKCIHLESLHAHDAVSSATKGVASGYRPHLELF